MMHRLRNVCAGLLALAMAGAAQADVHRLGYSGRHSPRPGHYDYQPGHYDSHRGHYDYQPSHYDTHRGGTVNLYPVYPGLAPGYGNCSPAPRVSPTPTGCGY